MDRVVGDKDSMKTKSFIGQGGNSCPNLEVARQRRDKKYEVTFKQHYSNLCT